MKVKQKKRNPYAFDPIMRKGGVHEKTNKAKRRKHKLQMQKEAANWQPYLFLALLKKYFSAKMFLETKKSPNSISYQGLLNIKLDDDLLSHACLL